MALSLTPLVAADYGAWLAALQERFGTLLPAGAPGRKRAEALDALAHALPGGLDTPATEIAWVTDGDRRVGQVWLSYVDGACVVRDVRVDDPAAAAEELALVRDRGTAANADGLAAWWTIGDASHEAFVAAGDFTTVSTCLALPLDSPQSEPGTLRLRPMTAEEFASWTASEVESYAAERARNGEPLDVARRRAEEQSAELLPDGAGTAGHQLWIGESAGSRVGLIWLDVRHPYAFVYSVAVDEAVREHGYGRALMQAGAYAAQQAGASGIALNVFGDNVAARRLYDSLGYRPTQSSVRLAL